MTPSPETGVRDGNLAEELRDAAAAGDRGRLIRLLAAAPPVDVADALAGWEPSAVLAVVRAATAPAAGGAARAAAILEHLPYDVQAAVLSALDRPLAARVLRAMSPDDVANLLGEVPPPAAEPILTLLSPTEQAEIRELLEYPETSAGGLMTTEFITVSADDSIAEVLAALRRRPPPRDTGYYLYAREADGRLAGVLSLRELVVADPERRVREVMVAPVVTVPPELDQEAVARVLERYDLVAVPVVDGGRVLGVVTVDDVLDVLEAEATEDAARLGGSQPLDEPYLAAGVWQLVHKRFWWLLVLILAGAVTGTILRRNQDVLEQVLALAFFIPLLIATGGNAGAQAASLVIRGLALGELGPGVAGRVVLRELAVGALLGAPVAVLAFVRAAILDTSPLVAVTVALTMGTVVVLATSFGALLPLVAARLRFDPAVVSAPLLTTVIDAVGTLVYFWVARAVLRL